MADVRLIFQISKGLIRDQSLRRHIMFYTVLVALVMLFLGATFLWQWLYERKYVFFGYWAACAWITLLAMLLALFDMLMVRAAARRARRELEIEILRKAQDESEA